MAISSANAGAAPKVLKKEMLTSGTSWTVPTGVDFVIATLVGGGAGGQGAGDNYQGAGSDGSPGASITTTVATTPGASIAYAIGAGGAQNGRYNLGSAGGNTTFTGATTASGGDPLTGSVSIANNGGRGSASPASGSGGAGGSGWINLEYWV
jgi:hypothetical protein